MVHCGSVSGVDRKDVDGGVTSSLGNRRKGKEVSVRNITKEVEVEVDVSHPQPSLPRTDKTNSQGV